MVVSSAASAETMPCPGSTTPTSAIAISSDTAICGFSTNSSSCASSRSRMLAGNAAGNESNQFVVMSPTSEPVTSSTPTSTTTSGSRASEAFDGASGAAALRTPRRPPPPPTPPPRGDRRRPTLARFAPRERVPDALPRRGAGEGFEPARRASRPSGETAGSLLVREKPTPKAAARRVVVGGVRGRVRAVTGGVRDGRGRPARRSRARRGGGDGVVVGASSVWVVRDPGRLQRLLQRGGRHADLEPEPVELLEPPRPTVHELGGEDVLASSRRRRPTRTPPRPRWRGPGRSPAPPPRRRRRRSEGGVRELGREDGLEETRGGVIERGVANAERVAARGGATGRTRGRVEGGEGPRGTRTDARARAGGLGRARGARRT